MIREEDHLDPMPTANHADIHRHHVHEISPNASIVSHPVLDFHINDLLTQNEDPSYQMDHHDDSLNQTIDFERRSIERLTIEQRKPSISQIIRSPDHSLSSIGVCTVPPMLDKWSLWQSFTSTTPNTTPNYNPIISKNWNIAVPILKGYSN